MHPAHSSECAGWIAAGNSLEALMNVMQEYKSWNAEDKEALRELRAEVTAKIGVEPKLSDMIYAVTPGLATPEYLQGV